MKFCEPHYYWRPLPILLAQHSTAPAFWAPNSSTRGCAWAHSRVNVDYTHSSLSLRGSYRFLLFDTSPGLSTFIVSGSGNWTVLGYIYASPHFLPKWWLKAACHLVPRAKLGHTTPQCLKCHFHFACFTAPRVHPWNTWQVRWDKRESCEAWSRSQKVSSTRNNLQRYQVCISTTEIPVLPVKKAQLNTANLVNL